MIQHPHIVTFSKDRHFSTSLASYLLNDGPYADSLSNVKLILPYNSAVLTVKEALLEASGKSSLIMPHISTFSDIKLEQWLRPQALQDTPVFKVVNTDQRLLWVSEFVQELMPHLSIRSSLYYAESFLNLRDDAQRAMKQTADFDALVDTPYAIHWQEALSMFKQVMKQLDVALDTHNLIEPIAHDNQVKIRIAEHIKSHGLTCPVIIAGSTASVPSTARFMQAVASQERGIVILPSLDMEMPKHYWEHITGSQPHYAHPQYHMKRFLDACGVTRDHIHHIEISQSDSTIISQAMYPQEAAGLLLEHPVSPEQVNHIELYETDDDGAEMELCALLIVDAIHQGTTNIAVITEQRDAIDRLQCLLARCGVDIDRFAELPLTHSSEYPFMMLCAALLYQPYNSLSFLNLLRHPLCLPTMRSEILNMAEYCDATLLRGFHHLRSVAEVCDAYIQKTGEHYAANVLKTMFEQQSDSLSCEGLYQRHKALIEGLLQGSRNSTLSNMLHELSVFTPLMHEKRECHAHDYCELVEHYFKRHPMYDKHISSSPIRVLGPIEARILNADLVIIPHMNEGHWPRHVNAEPWLNHAMRRAAGLNFTERQIGLAAHDISSAMKAPRLVALRARKESNTPMHASRFFERLKLICQPDANRIAQQQTRWEQYLQQWRIHEAQKYRSVTVTKPEPNPPLALRHMRLSATQCETLMKNPFILYVSHILKLSDRDPYDEMFGVKHFGIAAHKAMHKAAKTYQFRDFSQYKSALTYEFEHYLQEHVEPELRHFYIKKTTRILDTVLQEEAVRAQAVKNLLPEYKLQKEVVIDNTRIHFNMRADRIEELADAWRIIDYKTGNVPESKDVERGIACQLLVAGWIARDAHRVSDLEYWEMKGGADTTLVQSLMKKKINLEDNQFWEDVHQGLTNLARYYCCNPDAKFIWIEEKEGYAKGAAHIARVGEW